VSRFRVAALDPYTLRACAAELEHLAEIADAIAQVDPTHAGIGNGKRLTATRWRKRAERIERARGRG